MVTSLIIDGGLSAGLMAIYVTEPVVGIHIHASTSWARNVFNFFMSVFNFFCNATQTNTVLWCCTGYKY